MDDQISRKAAIDALADMHCKSDEDGYVWIIRSDAWARIDALPSVQPEKRTEKRTETHACDLIDREAAVDAIYHHFPSVSRTRARTMLHEVPSAQPERKKGKWIIRDNPGTGWYRVTCSECGEDVTSTVPAIGFLPNAKVLWDYCPWCGARMTEEDV